MMVVWIELSYGKVVYTQSDRSRSISKVTKNNPPKVTHYIYIILTSID
jgi:hypothetical protein